MPPQAAPRVVGRYALHAEIGSGGMAAVHLGRLEGPVGFAKTVAIKRLHSHFSRDPQFVSMLIDEARLAARIRHPNVVSTLDVVSLEGELFVIMEYVHGESLHQLLRRAAGSAQRLPVPIVASLMSGVLQGLHAAHEAKNDQGIGLGIVHRDVSPHNIIVGIDGVARVLDFGVAKAVDQIHTTESGQLKGKVAYMAPEQVAGAMVNRKTDVFAAGIVLWEALTGKRLFAAENAGALLSQVLNAPIAPPSRFAPEVGPALDGVVMCALERDASRRFPSAREMAAALEAATTIATQRAVGEWVEQVARDALTWRSAKLAAVENAGGPAPAPGVAPEPAPPPIPTGGGVTGSQRSAVATAHTSTTPAHTKRTGLVLAGAATFVGVLILGVGAVLALRSTGGPGAPAAASEGAVAGSAASLPATAADASAPVPQPADVAAAPPASPDGSTGDAPSGTAPVAPQATSAPGATGAVAAKPTVVTKPTASAAPKPGADAAKPRPKPIYTRD